jgi:hypothetical protein
MTDEIDRWLESFRLDDWIRDHVAIVMEKLPGDIRADFMEDPSFAMCDYDPGPKAVLHVPIQLPGRSVVLKRTLKRRPTDFVRWLIAHELAHAYLRHGGHGAHSDPENAADSLAAEWGFPKPENPW